MKRRERQFSGTTDPSVSKRELANREVARRAAEEGIVLMKNEGVLPLAKDSSLALFGSGAGRTIKGGTGSGDVCEREVVSISQGLVNAGVKLTSLDWIDDYERRYTDARNEWKEEILKLAGGAETTEFFQVYAEHAFEMPAGRKITKEDCKDAGTAAYVISRVAGEGADRFHKAGDYCLTENEIEDLKLLSEYCDNVIVILNTGGQIDLQEILSIPQVKALICLSQPGMEGGNALASVMTGKTSPCGKLVDTWAVQYEDFPNYAIYSHNNGDVSKEKYEEGIYVGYRYFDSFQVKPAFPFGFGLSYTDFALSDISLETKENQAVLEVTVKNTGSVYAGKEVVQVYAACPQDQLPKEYKRLCGFAKTEVLNPGESQNLKISFEAKDLASFDEEQAAWILEAGQYGIFVGTSSENAEIFGILEVKETVILEKVQHICPLKEELTELLRPDDLVEQMEREWKEKAARREVPVVGFAPVPEKKKTYEPDELDKKAEEITEQLTDEQLIAMVIGEVSRGHNQALGAAGIMVPGAAGETSSILEKDWDVPGIAMADGPAGLRVIPEYEADPVNREVYSQGFLGAFEGGFFAKKEKHENAVTYYQYCTAIPVGTLLAQTWNTKLLEEVGHAIGIEMEELGIAWWLAPGMNIHRNPLCGRNFEYYSEDPMLSGKMAAAMTNGVQSVPGVGTTIKHFACNNQEDNRLGSDSILSERTLREIYLRGFEIAVKTSQPMAIMSSYNLINGVHAANCRDTCTVAAREEWGFQGIIMTDWTTTSEQGGSKSWKCPAAGNDLIMPGDQADSRNIREALENGELDREQLKDCVKRLLKVIFQTLGYEECKCYRKV